MKQFIFWYLLTLALLFTLLYAPIWDISTLLNYYQTQFTLFLLEFFLNPHQVDGNAILIHSNYLIRINQSCNGMVPLLFLSASLLAYPSTIKAKIVGVTIGYFVVTIINILRILFVVYITQNGAGHADFYWSHDIVGNSILTLGGLFYFILFIKSTKRSLFSKK